MASKIIPSKRISVLNDKPTAEGDYVLYWMQQSQRAEENHALEFAIRKANDLSRPVIVAFGLTADYPEANLRHYSFMLQGLRDAAETLHKRGIGFVVRHGSPPEVALGLGHRASIIICDRGYLRHQKDWRSQVAEDARCVVFQVEADAIVPVDEASDKQEFAARTIRSKLMEKMDGYVTALRETAPEYRSAEMTLASLDLHKDDSLLGPMSIDSGVKPVPLFAGGTREAKKMLGRFIARHLGRYAGNRNQPHTNSVSHMSKYLHFGQISPAYIARRIMQSSIGTEEDRSTYIDELLVRRELTINYVHFNGAYDRFDSLPEWTKKTLGGHRDDTRPHTYTRRRLEDADTHDPYWNAAMNEMKHTGYMHNYMRMYWGKKILEWCDTPEYAYRTALYLNNKYFIDGRDPNSFANIGWIFGLHDRPWQERPIYGKVRLMTAKGLERKTSPRLYMEKVDRLMDEVRVQEV